VRAVKQDEELPEAQRAARRAQGALRPARAQRADSREDRTRKRTPLDAKKHKQGGHGPPTVSRQLC